MSLLLKKTFLPKLLGYSYSQNKRQSRLFMKKDDHFQKGILQYKHITMPMPHKLKKINIMRPFNRGNCNSILARWAQKLSAIKFWMSTYFKNLLPTTDFSFELSQATRNINFSELLKRLNLKITFSKVRDLCHHSTSVTSLTKIN